MLSSIFSGLRSGGESPSRQQTSRHVVWMDIDIVKRPRPIHFVTIGYMNGYNMYQLVNDRMDLVSSRISEKDCQVTMIKILPSFEIPKNLALVDISTSNSTLQFVDMTSGNESFHMIRLTAPIVKLSACSYTVAVGIEGGKIHIFDSISLEEKFIVNCSRSIWDLSERWLAYNLVPQQATNLLKKGVGGDSFPNVFLGKVWQKIAALGQDAFDNVVLAVSQQEPPMMSSLQSPTSQVRTGIVAIQDSVTQKIISTVEEPGRPIECLQWSDCGSMLLVTSGNGHYVSCYGLEFEKDRNEVMFCLKATLNRGVTPATITRMCMDPYRKRVALCSGNGSVHLFSATGEWLGKISGQGKDAAIAFQGTHLLVANRTKASVCEYTVEEGGISKSQSWDDLVRAPDEENGNKPITSIHAPEKSSAEKKNLVELSTCKPCEVETWQSPLLSFWNVDAVTGKRSKITFNHRNFGVNLSYDTRETSFGEMARELETGLNTPLIDTKETEPKYSHRTTKEGFVQPVPHSASRPQ